jgi:hypothetical protein
MPEVVKITRDMLPHVYPLLGEFDPRVEPWRWESLFARQWDADEDFHGYALVDGGNLVGMLGGLFSKRCIEGRAVPFCNLHCWYVKPPYRSSSLLLIRPFLELKRHTITDFSPSPPVCEILKLLGFSTLDRTATILPVLPWAARRKDFEACEIVECQERDLAALGPVDQQIFRDHCNTPCGHALIRDASGCCYLVYSRVNRHLFPYCYVHYLSDAARFAKHHAAARRFLASRASSRLVILDSRHLQHQAIPHSFRVRANEKLYRTPDLQPHQIDTLYSEMPLLSLSTLLSLRAMVSLTARRVLPSSAVSRIRSLTQKRPRQGAT